MVPLSVRSNPATPYSRSVVWCAGNITTRHPHFEFNRLDVKDDLRNPSGVVSNLDTVLPAEDHSVDRTFGQSVFSLMFEDEIVHHLREFRRILRTGGLVSMWFFITDQNVINNPSPVEALSITHPHGKGCFVHDPDRPRGAAGTLRFSPRDRAAHLIRIAA